MVFIIIGIQNGLDELKRSLMDLGYEVVEVENYNYPIEAIVYTGHFFQLSHITGNNMPEMSTGSRSNYGVLLVNAMGKSPEEIDMILKRRSYSVLF